ncbi:MAG: hypothetical protein KUG77_01630 [Nannocystaceae bacterium]|nr:hypothetical protein [Nannocystaceae bacterium]
MSSCLRLLQYGHLRLGDIRRREIDASKADKHKSGLKPGTINNQLGVLSKLLKVAVVWELIEGAPAVGLLNNPKPQFDYLDFNEADRLLAGAVSEPLWWMMILVGLRTTIGIGYNSDTMTLNQDESTLLSTNRALALTPADCVASLPHVPDSAACLDGLSDDALEVSMCGATEDVRVQRPALSTVCLPHESGFVSGNVHHVAGARVGANSDGSVTLFPGSYEAQWWTTGALGTPTGQRFQIDSEVTRQPIVLSQVDTADVCCEPGQLQRVLTTNTDTFTYTRSLSWCVSAEKGSDTVTLGSGDDTVMERMWSHR